MILVTGAAGKTGRAVIRALASRGESVRVLVHRPDQIRAAEELGAREVVVGDMRAQATMDQAVRGVRAVYHICPNMHPEEVAIGQIAIAAVRAAGVERFVYHSVLHPQIEAMPHHWLKMRVEEQLFQSGLSYTILQPAAYMQNVLAQWEHVLEQGVYPVPYSAGTRLSMVDLEDVAEAAATVLTEPGHEGATYELAGSEVETAAEALTQTEVAAILSQQLGRPVRAETVPLGTAEDLAWENQARESGLDEYQVKTLVEMFSYYDRHGFWGNPRVLSCLLGRPPTSFAAFVERVARDRLGPGTGQPLTLSSRGGAFPPKRSPIRELEIAAIEVIASQKPLAMTHTNTVETTMTSELNNYLQRIEDLRGQVRDLIAGLPAEALNWHLLEEDESINSLAVLAAHIAGAEHFWIAEVVGGRPPTRDRDAEFTAEATDASELVHLLENIGAETREVFATLTEADPSSPSGQSLDGTREARGRTIPVRWCILHVIDHTALHLGHIQLTYQLWNKGQVKPSPFWYERLS